MLELLLTLLLFGIGLAIILPGGAVARDHALLDISIWQVVSDLRTQQMMAEKTQVYQEVRFPGSDRLYYLYDGSTGHFTGRKIEPPVTYFEGILHLPQPTVRFTSLGNVSESGQIIIKDPEGALRSAVLYMQYGDVRVATSPLTY